MKKQIKVIIVIAVLIGSFGTMWKPIARAVAIIKVPNDYPTIQEAVDSAYPGDTILVGNGTYDERVILYEDGLRLVGENPEATIIDSDFTDETVYVTANNVYVGGFTIRNGATYGIYVSHVSNVSLVGNIIANNTLYGIYLDNSANSTVSQNTITNNGQGINLFYSSHNKIYHNSFLNTIEASAECSANTWDNGYPSGGNYWSNYNGKDYGRGPYQNLSRSDGIGDTPYAISENNTDHYPLTKPYAGKHDLGLKLAFSKTIIPEGYKKPVTMNVTIINYGEQAETYNFTFQLDTISYNQTMILASRDSQTLTFAWNTTALPKGKYVLHANLTRAPGETDTTDNAFAFTMIVTIPGDVDGNHVVNILDVVDITIIYATKQGNPQFNPNCDIDGDGEITVLDVVDCTINYGQKWLAETTMKNIELGRET